MVVAVTEDEGRSGGDVANNGLYLLTAADATQTSSWTKISTGSGVTIASVSDVDGVQTITMSDGTTYTTVIDRINLLEFDSNGGFYSVNEDADYEGGAGANNTPILFVQRGAKYKVLNSAGGAHPLIISKNPTPGVQDDPVNIDGGVFPLTTGQYLYWTIPMDLSLIHI